MTSANITIFTVKDSAGKTVLKLRMHALCKQDWTPLTKFQPYENYSIQSSGLDEEEEEWVGKIHNLRDFIGYLRVNRAKI